MGCTTKNCQDSTETEPTVDDMVHDIKKKLDYTNTMLLLLLVVIIVFVCLYVILQLIKFRRLA